MSACDMGALCCKSSPCTYWDANRNATELATLREARDSAWDTLDKVIGGTAQVLNCDRDNEAILEAIAGIQSQNARLRAEVARLRNDARLMALTLLGQTPDGNTQDAAQATATQADIDAAVARCAALAKEAGDAT